MKSSGDGFRSFCFVKKISLGVRGPQPLPTVIADGGMYVGGGTIA